MRKLELPEVETYRRDLEREIVTRKVKAVTAPNLKAMPQFTTKADFEQPLVGAKLVAAERAGMHLIMRFDNEYCLVIHLGEEGRLYKVMPKDAAITGTLAVVTFTQGGEIRVVDPGGESTVYLVHGEQLASALPPAGELGLDIQAQPISWVEFGRAVLAFDQPLKVMLTDPASFVGIGDVYSNEILFDAGLRYDRQSSSLSTQEIRRLYRSVAGIIHEAVRNRGTSLEDRPFTDLMGDEGEYAEQLKVWGKDGDLSPRSRVPIKKAKYKNQVVYYCGTQV